MRSKENRTSLRPLSLNQNYTSNTTKSRQNATRFSPSLLTSRKMHLNGLNLGFRTSQTTTNQIRTGKQSTSSKTTTTSLPNSEECIETLIKNKQLKENYETFIRKDQLLNTPQNSDRLLLSQDRKINPLQPSTIIG